LKVAKKCLGRLCMGDDSALSSCDEGVGMRRLRLGIVLCVLYGDGSCT